MATEEIVQLGKGRGDSNDAQDCDAITPMHFRDAHYTGDGEAEIVPRPTCGPILCPIGATLSAVWAPSPVDALGLPAQAVLDHVDTADAPFVRIETRVRDLSVQERSAGTEIPAIAEDEMFSRTFSLLDIPIAARFRNTLRIYALPETASPAVDVRYYRLPKEGFQYSPGKVLLRTERVVLQTYGETEGYRLQPSVAFVGNFQTLPELACLDRDRTAGRGDACVGVRVCDE